MMKDFNEQDSEKIRETAARDYIKGMPKYKIAAHIAQVVGKPFTVRRLNKLLEDIFETWRKKGIYDTVLARALEINKIDAREAELWAAWERSKQNDDTGNSRYLTELRRCSEQRSRLLGLDCAHIKKTEKKQDEKKQTIVWNEKKSYEPEQKTNPRP